MTLSAFFGSRICLFEASKSMVEAYFTTDVDPLLILEANEERIKQFRIIRRNFEIGKEQFLNAKVFYKFLGGENSCNEKEV